MVMAHYQHAGISIESWVEMDSNVNMRYEVNPDSDSATLFFGRRNAYVLTLNRENLDQVIDLATRASAELRSANPDDA
jgi:hypothetical protein